MPRFTSLSLLCVSVFALSACATSLQSRPAPDIAAQAYRAMDSYTGLEQTSLPQISSVFMTQNGASGSASLQSAESFEGSTGGAWLDVVLDYKTPNPDEAQMRVYNQAIWYGGTNAKLADFGAAVESCAEHVEGAYNIGLHNSGLGFNGFGYGYGNGRGRRPVNRKPVTVTSPSPQPTPSPSPVRPTISPPGPEFDELLRYKKGLNSTPDKPRPPRARTVRSSSSQSTSKSFGRSSTRASSAAPTRSKPKQRRISRSALRTQTDAAITRTDQGVVMQSRSGQSGSDTHLASKSTGAKVSHKSYGHRSTKRFYNYGHYGRFGYGSGLNLGGRDVYTIKSICKRRESLRIYVSADQLRNASAGGLRLALKAKSGHTGQVMIPSNYVHAYRLAMSGQNPVPSYE